MKKLKYIFMISILGLLCCKTNTKIAEKKTDTGVEFEYKPTKAAFSDFQTIIIPKNPNNSYSRENVSKLIDYLSKQVINKEINLSIDSSVSFVDCGQEFEKVFCPNCGKEIDLDFWHELMEKASANDFSDLTIQTKCCNTSTNLNSLRYIADCGFAKSKIIIYDPETRKINQNELLVGIKRICGFDSKIIKTHY
ncbi:MAG: hypothetical protein PHR83_00440 [Paludibacter sp.]|nr:hypothetical protein [Paludibacter sp.]